MTPEEIAEMANKKDFVTIYLTIAGLLIALNSQIAGLWSLSFITLILVYYKLLTYDISKRFRINISAVMVGICFSVILFYCIVNEIMHTGTINYPFAEALFGNLIPTKDIEILNLTSYQRLLICLLGSIGSLVTLTLTIYKQPNSSYSSVSKSRKILWVIFIFIMIFIGYLILRSNAPNIIIYLMCFLFLYIVDFVKKSLSV